jgi:hypothetical protein
MKNVVKLFGIIAVVAVIGFSMAGFEKEQDLEYSDVTTAGRLTITDLGDYNGRRIEASILMGSLRLFAFERGKNEYNPNSNLSQGSGTQSVPATITNGQAELKVFVDKGVQSGKGGGYESYTGNDQNVMLYVSIDRSGIGTVTVSFSNGIGSGVFVPNP